MINTKLTSKRAALLAIVFVLGVGATAFSRRTRVLSDTAMISSGSSGPVPSTSRSVQEPGQPVQTIRVFIHPEDIYPGSVVVKSGNIDLVAENQTQGDISLVVERVNHGQANQSITAIRTVDHRSRNRQGLTLDAGVYVFYEASRPKQQGRIIVDLHNR